MQSIHTVNILLGDYTFSGINMYLKDNHGSMFSSIDIPTSFLLILPQGHCLILDSSVNSTVPVLVETRYR